MALQAPVPRPRKRCDRRDRRPRPSRRATDGATGLAPPTRRGPHPAGPAPQVLRAQPAAAPLPRVAARAAPGLAARQALRVSRERAQSRVPCAAGSARLLRPRRRRHPRRDSCRRPEMIRFRQGQCFVDHHRLRARSEAPRSRRNRRRHQVDRSRRRCGRRRGRLRTTPREPCRRPGLACGESPPTRRLPRERPRP